MSNKFNFSGTFEGKGISYQLSSLAIVQFKDSGNYILFAPALEVYGYGKTINEAKESFVTSMEEFLAYTTSKKTLESELKRLGWKIKGGSKSKRFKVPELSELMGTNERLSEIVNNKEFKTYRAEVPIAIPA